LNLRELKNLHAISAEDLKQMAAIAEKHGSGSRQGPERRGDRRAGSAARSGSLEPVKPKNVNQIDRDWLGLQDAEGAVATKEVHRRGGQGDPPAGSRAQPELREAGDHRAARDQLGEEKYLPELQRYAGRGEIARTTGTTASRPRTRRSSRRSASSGSTR
jgi:hypothetical protein